MALRLGPGAPGPGPGPAHRFEARAPCFFSIFCCATQSKQDALKQAYAAAWRRIKGGVFLLEFCTHHMQLRGNHARHAHARHSGELELDDG